MRLKSWGSLPFWTPRLFLRIFVIIPDMANGIELEARFLLVPSQTDEILIDQFVDSGAKYLGHVILTDLMYITSKGGFSEMVLRVRDDGSAVTLTRKIFGAVSLATLEEELEIPSVEYAVDLLENELGYHRTGVQQQSVHKFLYAEEQTETTIRRWPAPNGIIPRYVEVEGPSEEAIRSTAGRLGFDWQDVKLESPRWILTNYFGFPVRRFKKCTFDEILEAD